MSKSSRGCQEPNSASDAPLPTQQSRSARTTERLLDAAERILRERGSDAATLRAIADRAGMSIGAVYRRFRNKDAVLRAVYRRFFASVRNRNRRALHEAASRKAGTTQLLEAVVRGIAEGYRRHKDLLRPLALYVRTHPDRAFRGRARKLNAAVFADLRPLLMNTQPGIRHPQPEIAVTFAVSAIAAVLQEQILFDDVTSLPPLGDHELICEAARMMRSYLAGCPSKTDAATLESSNVSS